MEQQKILRQLRKRCLSSLANEPIDATEKELGYSAAMADIIKIIDEQTNKKVNETAVEWFAIQLYEQGYFDGSTPKSITNIDHLQEQAKQMEKKQIMIAYMKNLPIEDGVITAVQKAENYYNETFKTK